MNLKSQFSLVERFNECINSADIEGLTALMTMDHTFIDKAGTSVSGKATVTAAWTSFFMAFPGYRNIFERHREAKGFVAIQGRSACADPRLNGAALWRAKLREGKLSEWQVYTDSAENRQALGL
jgi:ketosteroid isomerase-like protein